MALLTVVNAQGHTTLEYDVAKTDELDEARTTFDDMVKKGYLGFADGIPTTDFNSEAELTTLAPLVAGG